MSFSCSDKDTLIAYIYGECDAATRTSVETHLALCPACTDEVGGFGMVRDTLSRWSAPEGAGSYRIVREDQAAPAAAATVLRPARWWKAPASGLARVAAAVLLLAGGAALANLRVRYDGNGFEVRTGWSQPQPSATTAVVAPSPAPAPADRRPPAAVPVPASLGIQEPAPSARADAAAWRAELASVERRLRDEFRQQMIAAPRNAAVPVQTGVAQPAPATAGFDESRFMQRIYTLLDDSERRQQTAWTYQINQVVNDMQRGEMRRTALPSAQPTIGTQPRSTILFGTTPVTIRK